MFFIKCPFSNSISPFDAEFHSLYRKNIKKIIALILEGFRVSERISFFIFHFSIIKGPIDPSRASNQVQTGLKKPGASVASALKQRVAVGDGALLHPPYVAAQLHFVAEGWMCAAAATRRCDEPLLRDLARELIMLPA